MKLNSYLTEYTEINLKWVIDKKVTTKMITVLEENSVFLLNMSKTL